MDRMTILDDGAPSEVPYVADDGVVRVPAGDVHSALGWAVEDRGLCRGDICIPIRDEALVTDGGVSLPALAAALGRPLAVDEAERAAYLGASARDRTAAMAGLVAPDFTLPDLDGQPHSLAEHRGSKVLLAAWASW